MGGQLYIVVAKTILVVGLTTLRGGWSYCTSELRFVSARVVNFDTVKLSAWLGGHMDNYWAVSSQQDHHSSQQDHHSSLSDH